MRPRRRRPPDRPVRRRRRAPWRRSRQARRRRSAVQVRADGGVAVVGQTAGELLVELVPAGHVHDHDDAWEGTITVGPSDVGVDLVAIGAGDLDGAGAHARRGCRVERIPHSADGTTITFTSRESRVGHRLAEWATGRRLTAGRPPVPDGTVEDAQRGAWPIRTTDRTFVRPKSDQSDSRLVTRDSWLRPASRRGLRRVRLVHLLEVVAAGHHVLGAKDAARGQVQHPRHVGARAGAV